MNVYYYYVIMSIFFHYDIFLLYFYRKPTLITVSSNCFAHVLLKRKGNWKHINLSKPFIIPRILNCGLKWCSSQHTGMNLVINLELVLSLNITSSFSTTTRMTLAGLSWTPTEPPVQPPWYQLHYRWKKTLLW